MNRSKMLVWGTAFVLACGLAADTTGAQGNGKGKSDTKSAASSGTATTVVVLGAHIVVMNKERNLIGDFALNLVR